MFDNVGKKIMNLAKILVVLDIIATIILAIFLGAEVFREGIIGIIVGLASGTVSVISCWPLYAFGQLVDDVHAIRYNNTAAAAEPVVKEYEVPEL